MDRVMSVEERIRRAEDIYNKRNGEQYTQNITKEKNNKFKKSKKLLMQIFVFLSIYIVFYTVTNREHIFSEEFRNEVSMFFTNDLNNWYLNVKNFIEGNTDSINNEQFQETTENNTDENKQEETKDENIGGATETKEDKKDEVKEEKELSDEEKMKKDAEEIKNEISFIAPIKGRISSSFGWRNPTTETVPKYHTGVDIAANEGTIIKSATDGIVTLVSEKGDYGKHYQIKIKDIVIIYAHCKKLYLKEGDEVKQGQEIAEVGSTGNSTGPHLHFEIRKGNEKINPQLILNI